MGRYVVKGAVPTQTDLSLFVRFGPFLLFFSIVHLLAVPLPRPKWTHNKKTTHNKIPE